jgi:hypothetical protein
MTREKYHVEVQMDKDTHQKLARLAAQSHRSRSSVICTLVRLAAGDGIRELGLPHHSNLKKGE